MDRPFPGVIAHHILAVTHQSIRDGANLGAYAKTVNGVFVQSNQAQSTNINSQTQYDITADINGPLNILNTDVGGEEAIASGTKQQLVTFSAVPTLSQQEILAILGAQDLLATVGADPSTAANSFATRAIYNSLVPQYLAPITDGIQSWLNLEDFSVSYDPSGYSQIFLAKRLPAPFDKPPFDRFLVQYTQQLQTRSSHTANESAAIPIHIVLRPVRSEKNRETQATRSSRLLHRRSACEYLLLAQFDFVLIV